MPPRARNGLRKPAQVTGTPTRRSTRRAQSSQYDAVPAVFHDLLSDAEPSQAAAPDEDNRPLKKRKTRAYTAAKDEGEARHSSGQPARSVTMEPRSEARNQHATSDQPANPTKSINEPQPKRAVQTVEDSDESDDSDMEWEDALGVEDSDDAEDDVDQAIPEVGDLSITIDGGKGKETVPGNRAKRRGITSVDKKRRLEIHKMHLLCLLYHVHRRNAWCNDERVQATLRKLPSPKALSCLVPNPEFSQYQASKRFIDGMHELKTMWSNRFVVTALGMHRPRWTDAEDDVQAFSTFEELDAPMDRQDFRKAAASLRGSQDVGAQLFCALLRSIGVEARLVCSLQCLPFTYLAQPATPRKKGANQNTIQLDPYNQKESASPSKVVPTRARPKRLSRLEIIFGERHPALSGGVAPKQQKKYHTAYPVYWVEALNSAQQKWVSIDPLSTFTVDRPEKLEPPLNNAQNILAYAVAYDEDYTVKDVTRRYAKAYNAKTRKLRIDSTDHGDRWWKQSLSMFKRTNLLDRDQVEDATLARREAGEGIPKNVQDFKGHPIYILERHLRHNEVIYPLHQVGKVNVGSAMNPKMEPIYRRKEVHIVRSADKWYRLGRDIKDGEQPLKHAKPKKGSRRSLPPDVDVDDQQEETGAGLYAEFQTELYTPPSVVRGRVPRNAYGNLDVYVPSMVPPGGAHIRHKQAAKAARIVGVDYAEAVTGFSFKGRHGTAVIQGIIVAQEYKDAVEAVLDGMEYAQEEAEISLRRDEALRMWRRFFLGLRVAQRVNAIEIDGQTGPVVDVQAAIDAEDKALAEEQLAGGFFPDEGSAIETEPSKPRGHEHRMQNETEYATSRQALVDAEGGGGFVPEDFEQAGGFLPDDSQGFGSSLLAEQKLRPPRQEEQVNVSIQQEDSNDTSGFSPESQPEVSEHMQLDGAGDPHGGGFIPETEPMEGVTADEPPQSEKVSKGINEPIENLNNVESKYQLVAPAAISETFAVSPSAAVPDKEDVAKLSSVSAATDGVPPSSSSPSETGSLLLEDPEDEDADPDWLVDAT